jgi:hypothetical protein
MTTPARWCATLTSFLAQVLLSAAAQRADAVGPVWDLNDAVVGHCRTALIPDPEHHQAVAWYGALPGASTITRCVGGVQRSHDAGRSWTPASGTYVAPAPDQGVTWAVPVADGGGTLVRSCVTEDDGMPVSFTRCTRAA